MSTPLSQVVEIFATQMSLQPVEHRKPTVSQGPLTPVLLRQIRKIGVILHLYYFDLLQEFLAYFEYIPIDFHLHVSVVSDHDAARTAVVLQAWARAPYDIRVVINHGRDIAPKYVTFKDVYSADFDLLLFLHTKRSLTASFGEDWRKFLLDSLLGGATVTKNSIDAFERDPCLGVLAPAHFSEIARSAGWDGNYMMTSAVAKRLGGKTRIGVPPDFAAGSMYWARPSALRPLVDLGLQLSDFAAEAGQVSGTIAHALEKLVFFSAEVAGYRAAELLSDRSLRFRSSGIDRIGATNTVFFQTITVAHAAHLLSAVEHTSRIIMLRLTKRVGLYWNCKLKIQTRHSDIKDSRAEGRH